MLGLQASIPLRPHSDCVPGHPSRLLVLGSVPLCGSPGPSCLSTPNRLITVADQHTGTHRSWCLQPGATCISVPARCRLDPSIHQNFRHSWSASGIKGAPPTHLLKPNLPSGPACTTQMFLDRLYSHQPPRIFLPSPCFQGSA